MVNPGCESNWPCDTQQLVDELEASRRKLAAIREWHLEVPLTAGGTICLRCCDDWPCWTSRLLDGET